MWLMVAAAVDCSAPVPPTISISAKPSALDDKGGITELTLTALMGNGEPGKGAVKVTSTAGSLRDSESVTLGPDGKATVGFTCPLAADPLCKDKVRVVAEWTVNGEVIGTELRIQVGGSFTMGPRLKITWDDAGVDGPCLSRDAGAARPCNMDGTCQRGYTCVYNTQGTRECVLKGGTGDVQVTLRFLDPVDLDLHVYEPVDGGMGCHIYYADVGPNNSCGSKGALDLDSNPSCQLDNVDIENVIYPANRRPPFGEYGVDVNYYDTCSIGRNVPWQIEVRAGGELKYWCGAFATSQEKVTTPVTRFTVEP